jgi:hypothetical protein
MKYIFKFNSITKVYIYKNISPTDKKKTSCLSSPRGITMEFDLFVNYPLNNTCDVDNQSYRRTNIVYYTIDECI